MQVDIMAVDSMLGGYTDLRLLVNTDPPEFEYSRHRSVSQTQTQNSSPVLRLERFLGSMGFNEKIVVPYKFWSKFWYSRFLRTHKPCFTDVHIRLLPLKFSALSFFRRGVFLIFRFVQMLLRFFQDQIEIYKEKIVSDLLLTGV